MYEITIWYSAALGSLFCLLIFRRLVYYVTWIYLPHALDLVLHPLNAISRVASAYLVYPTVVHGGKYLHRWSRMDVLLLLSYIGATVCCIILPSSGSNQTILRSGTLSVVNLIFCYVGPSPGFLADILGLSLRSCHRLHASLGGLAVVLAVFHAAVGGVSKGRLNLDDSKDTFALVVRNLPNVLQTFNNCDSPSYVFAHR